MVQRFEEIEIASSDLVKLYQDRFGIDVEKLLPGGTVKLVEDKEIGFGRFRNCDSGTSEFYSELMLKIGYDDGEKSEFRAAAEYVANGQTVLDVGCGPGKFSNYCTGSYKGVELNPEAVKEAQAHGRNVVLETLEAQKDGAFDVVTLFQVLEHVDDPVAFFREAAKKVAPGGRIIVTTPNMGGYMRKSMNHVLNYPPHHLSWWDEHALRNLVETHGFSTKSVWKEPLQNIHVTDWVESLINPTGIHAVSFSPGTKALRAVSKAVAVVAGDRIQQSGVVEGQCIMIVADRPAA